MNASSVLDAIANLPHPLSAKEAAFRMADAWIARFGEWDSSHHTMAVEAGFYIQLDERTFVIGVCDRLCEDEQGMFACEWKTAKEPQVYKGGPKQGQPYDSWNEQVWLTEIARGPQLAIYALALQSGTYLTAELDSGLLQWDVTAVKQPRLLVRAAVKSAEPSFWPSANMGHMVTFPQQALDATRDALLNRAAQIRALRATGKLPWQTTGRHCVNRYDRKTLCAYYKHCSSFVYPDVIHINGLRTFDMNDPADKVYSVLRDNLLPDAVVLSASSYDLGNECMEKYRLVSNNLVEKETSEAMEFGSLFHSCLAAIYKNSLDK